MGTKAADTVDPINFRINAMRIIDDSPVSPRSELQDAIRDFNQAVASAQLRGARLVALLDDPSVVYKASQEDICKVRANVDRITNLAQSVTGAIDRSLIDIIVLRTGYRNPNVDGLLKYFKAEIDAIARQTLKNVDNRLEFEWRFVEECYNQAVNPSGSLYPKRFLFDGLDSLTEGPDHSLTATQRADQEIDRLLQASMRDDWGNFWLQTMNNCPSGPTLFHTRPSFFPAIHRSLDDIPRYLFRVYDSKSSGLNTDTVFASEHSFSQDGTQASKVDLFSLYDESASKMLHYHLERKNCFGGSASSTNDEQKDNLVSWTSSLMNAIQYALWRSHVGHTPTSNVYICAVDTRMFPRGQFARDMWLLDKHAHPESNWLRLENPTYDNGECLSQGTIHHGGRSSVFSLQDLVSSGLYELYPDFADPSAKYSWTNRVLELRASWREQHRTSEEEFSLACDIARGPLKEIDIWDAIMLLLTFRNRHPTWLYDRWDASDKHFPETDEVCRFKALLKLTENGFDSKLAQRGDLWSEEAKKDAHLKNMVLIKGTFIVQDIGLIVSTLTV